jgi:hypothetical protein
MKNRACQMEAIVGSGEGALQVHQGVTKGLEHRKQGGDPKRRGDQLSDHISCG